MKNDYRNEIYNPSIKVSEDPTKVDFDLKKKFRWYDHKILPILKESKEVKILELGCGPGHFLVYLREKGYQNTKGIDISEEQIRIAKGYGVDASVADVFDYLYQEGGKYDIVAAFDFLEHFSKKELVELLSQINNLLNPGGLFIIQTPNGMGLFPGQVIYGDLTHTTILNPHSLEQILVVNNFTQIQFYESGPVPSGLKGCFKVVLWNIIRQTVKIIRKIETGKNQNIWSENMICCCKKAS